MPKKLYAQLVDDIAKSVSDGVLKAGDRLPSIRDASRSRRLSITTVRHAYQVLESQGLIEGRPQSGYFVTARTASRSAAGAKAAPGPPVDEDLQFVDAGQYVLATLKSIRSHNAVPLASAYPDPALFPWRRMQARMREAMRGRLDADIAEDIPPGNPKLIRQIALRHMRNGLDVDPQEVIVTVGATEGLNLCLRAVARPGDTIAVESPTFYVMRKAAERLGMRVIELQTHPREGIDLQGLTDNLVRGRIDACLTMPNFQNPLGFVMPDANKRALVELAARHRMPLIENGVYNELYFGSEPPTTLKSFDTTGTVLHCGSFSKSLGGSVGVGWILAGKYRADIEQLKFLSTFSTSAIAQVAVAEFLAQDGWDQYLRSARQELRQRCEIMRGMVKRFFPDGTRISEPAGGYLLWVELPAGVDALQIARQAMRQGVSVTPGRIFGNSPDFLRCIRLNYSFPWTPDVEAAIKTLGALVAQAALASRKPTARAASPAWRAAERKTG